MNCDVIKELLSRAQPLTRPAQQHLESCTGCRAMLQALAAPQADPGTKHITEIQRLITAPLEPVRPLPSDPVLVGCLLALFAAFSVLAAVPVGYAGFHVLNAYQRFAYYGLILLSATWIAIATVQEMIPGSRRTAGVRSAILVPTLSLGLLVSLLFHSFGMERFVPLGIPCLRLGCICALVGGALSWFILRRGFATSLVAASTTAGFFAGLAGVAVLALHCPIQNSAHILVWHLGAMLLGGLGGAVVGTFRR